MRTPPLNALKAYEAVSRTGSLTRAADELFVTPTAVGRHIKKLEDYLGVPLFERRNGQLVTTEASRRFAKALHRSFAGIVDATNELLRTSGRMHLVIKVYTTFLVHWLMPKLGAFQQEHPEIELNIESGFGRADFQNDRVDIAIRYGDGEWPNLKAFRIFQDELVPFCSPALAPRVLGIPPTSWPTDISLIVHGRRPDDWPDWLSAQNLSTPLSHKRLGFEDLLMVYRAAQDSLGVAITQKRYISDDVERGILVPVSDSVLKREQGYYAICPADVAETKAAMIFIEWIQRQGEQPNRASAL